MLSGKRCGIEVRLGGLVKISCAEGTPPSMKTRYHETRESFQRKDANKFKAIELVSLSRCTMVPG
jgi:hypothetical protein